MLPVNVLANAAEVYAGDVPLNDPKVSPVFGDLRGFPPLMVLCGSTEIVRSDAESIAHNAEAAGVPVDLRVWPKQPHAFPGLAQYSPEARAAITEMGSFLKLQIKPNERLH